MYVRVLCLVQWQWSVRSHVAVNNYSLQSQLVMAIIIVTCVTLLQTRPEDEREVTSDARPDD